jgi:hypothetical protein
MPAQSAAPAAPAAQLPTVTDSAASEVARGDDESAVQSPGQAPAEEATESPATEVSSVERLRTERIRTEIQNEDLIAEKLEEQRLTDEKRRLSRFLVNVPLEAPVSKTAQNVKTP